MHRDQELTLIERSLAVLAAPGVAAPDDEAQIPVGQYVDPTQFDREVQRIFRPALNVVALSSAVAQPGDFITADVMGTPVLVVRGDDGTARAFINVCRHRGATVEGRASGRCKAFVCPYHAWTYGTDGRLRHVRHPEGFPSLRGVDTTLVPLCCLEGAGLLWVCPDPAASHLEFDPDTQRLIAELEGLLGPQPTAFATHVRDWNANWKLVTDGGLESYHFRIAHRDTIAPFFTDTASTYEFIGDHIRSVLPRRSLAELVDRPRETWRLREHANVLYTLHPNAMLLVQDSHFELILSTPLDPGRTRIAVSTVGRPPGPDGYGERARAFLQRNHALTCATLAEDFVLAEQIQAGLHTGANEHFRLGRFEGALRQWHRRLDARLDLSG
ncbi:MAG: SRPBCC family protein [Myxococcota bacterium]